MTRLPLSLAACIIACASLTAQFRSTVQTVAVYATVKDQSGRLVPDLTREAFQVFDNGMHRIGLGHDTHHLAPGKPLVIGGVVIPHETGPVAHSDGGVVISGVAEHQD